ncbi:MAG: hypothetical protein WAV06_06380 [Terracidiphilus sp.]
MNAWIAHKTIVMNRLLFLAILITGSAFALLVLRPKTVGASASSSKVVVERAQSAFDFVNSIGVNTHLNYFDRTYGNFPLLERELRSIGIRHLRDGAHLQDADYNQLLYGRWIELGKLGIRFDVVLDPRSNLGALTPQLLEKLEDLSGHTIESFEGANELDISNMSGWPAVDRSFQQQIYSAAKLLPDAGTIRVIGPSLAFAAHGDAFAGSLSGFDEGNLHPYPAAKMPSVIFPEQTDLARQAFGDKPIVITESGYHNALNDHSDQPAVSEGAAAKYVPRLFLEDFSRGIVRTYLYELLDEAPDPGLRSNQMHWGLIRADGAEKPAFVATKRLINELNDTKEPASPVQLAWSLSRASPVVHHLLLQKSGGELDLVLWQEVSSYDFKNQREIVNPPVQALLTLGSRARAVKLFEPVVQDEPVKSFVDTATVPLEIPDHPIVVAIKLN